ncbi:hypothetical protein F5Y09DRAFT_323984 [Xylaria sp. FL1042]|nr:hypothetical protein F5Y09DRAFT_323984 [Xylaria sp. FL1042]
MPRSDDVPATLSLFGEPRINKYIANLPGPCTSPQNFPLYQYQKALESHNTYPLHHVRCEDLQKMAFAVGTQPGYLEFCLPHSSSDYNHFQNAVCLGQVKQTLLEYLSEGNLVHDAWQALLQGDATCSGTNPDSWELKIISDSSRP